MYANTNFKSRKALKDAVAKGVEIGYHQPGPFGGQEITDGRIYLEGPWYPQPHTWYATAEVKNGIIIKVK